MSYTVQTNFLSALPPRDTVPTASVGLRLNVLFASMRQTDHRPELQALIGVKSLAQRRRPSPDILRGQPGFRSEMVVCIMKIAFLRRCIRAFAARRSYVMARGGLRPCAQSADGIYLTDWSVSIYSDRLWPNPTIPEEIQPHEAPI